MNKIEISSSLQPTIINLRIFLIVVLHECKSLSLTLRKTRTCSLKNFRTQDAEENITRM